jgi:hypothetical protein
MSGAKDLSVASVFAKAAHRSVTGCTSAVSDMARRGKGEGGRTRMLCSLLFAVQ